MTAPAPSARRRGEILSALRRGTVPATGLDALAVGLDRLGPALEAELDATVSGGSGQVKAVRGEYGAGKTFLARWLGERAKARGMAVAEVQVSESETPLHRLETVYRRVCESLSTADAAPSAFRPVLDSWLFTLEEDVLAAGTVDGSDDAALGGAVDRLLETRLGDVARTSPAFAAGLRGYRAALSVGDAATADGLAAWLGGQPHVAAAAKRAAGVRGDLDHTGALSSLQGLLTVLRDSDRPGLLLVLDEVETLQRVRGDVRDKGLNALRQLMDQVEQGRFPGLYLLVTGTPAFFDGPQGVARLPPLAARLATDFTTDARFDNPRAVQVRLPGFDVNLLAELGRRVRDLYLADAVAPDRVARLVDDAYLSALADALGGRFGGRVGIVPRLFAKKLVADVLDRVDQHEDFDPRRDYALTLTATELTDAERNAAAAAGSVPVVPATSADDVDLPGT